MTHHVKIIICLILVLSMLLGIGIGLLIGLDYYKIKIAKAEARFESIRVKGYKFISPLLDYETPSELKNREVIILKNKIQEVINENIRDNNVLYVSVYYRDLMNGPWFGINEDENFAPASLLKVPLMIAYLKYAEQHPDVLNEKLAYDKAVEDMSDSVRQNIIPDKELEFGRSYSVEDLIYRMIIYSDNVAKNILYLHIKEEAIDRIYKDIGIIVPGIREKGDFINVKDYSSFFTILFNASYLNRDMSEKALEILSKSSFKIGIAAGLPIGITVAHKFAERGDDTNQTMQLHDCAIVYYKKRPYLLCIMTYGRDFIKLTDVIKDISSIVYNELDSAYR